MAQKNHGKPKHKEVENHTPLCVDSIGPRADSSASAKGRHGESRVGLPSCKKPASANQQIDSSGPTKRPVLNAMQEDMTRFLLKEKTEESLLKITPWQPCHLSSSYSVPENPRTEPQKHKPTNKALPGKSLTFSPPVQSLRINPGSCHVCRGKKAPNGENPEQNFFTFNRKSAARRTGVDIVANPDLCIYSAAPTSEYHTSHHKPHLFSTLSLLKKNQLLMSPISGTAHPTRCSVDKSITGRSANAYTSQVSLLSTTSCAIKLKCSP